MSHMFIFINIASCLVLIDIVSKFLEYQQIYLSFFVKKKSTQLKFYLLKLTSSFLLELSLWGILILMGLIQSFDYIWLVLLQFFTFIFNIISKYNFFRNYEYINICFMSITLIAGILNIGIVALLCVLYLIAIMYVYIKWENTLYISQNVIKSSFFKRKNIFFIKLLKYICFFSYVKISNLWQYMPIEQCLSVISLFLVADVENIYKNNRKLLLIFQSRYFINLTRKYKPNLTFLSVNQYEKLKIQFLEIIILCLAISVFTNKVIEFFILSMGVISITLFTLDSVIYGYLLQRSYLYYNKIVKEMLSLILSGLFFSYFMFITVAKVMSHQHVEFDIFSSYYNIFILILFSVLNIVFVIRHHKVYKQ